MRGLALGVCMLLAGCSFYTYRSSSRPASVEVKPCTGGPATCAPTPPPPSACKLWPVLVDGGLAMAAGAVVAALEPSDPFTEAFAAVAILGGPVASMFYGLREQRRCTDRERPPEPGDFHVRVDRYTAGMSVGPGITWTNGHHPSCSQCGGNGGQGLFVGRMLTSRLELLAELRTTQGNLVDSLGYAQTVTQGALLLGTQYWLQRSTWVRGGLGPSYMEGPDPYDFGKGAAASASLGYELLSRRNMAIDIILGGIRGQYGRHQGVTGVSAELALTFY